MQRCNALWPTPRTGSDIQDTGPARADSQNEVTVQPQYEPSDLPSIGQGVDIEDVRHALGNDEVLGAIGGGSVQRMRLIRKLTVPDVLAWKHGK